MAPPMRPLAVEVRAAACSLILTREIIVNLSGAKFLQREIGEGLVAARRTENLA